MGHFTWQAARDVCILVVGIALTFVVWHLNRNVQEADEHSTIAIANECRTLLALSQPLTPDGPCYDPEVYAIWVDLPVEPVQAELVKEDS